MSRQARKEEKAERKRAKKEAAQGGPPTQAPGGSESGDDESSEETDESPGASSGPASPSRSPASRGAPPVPGLEAGLPARLEALFEEGMEIWSRFDVEVRQKDWHPFVPADYHRVLDALLPLRAPGLRFLEWGSATGVITIMADLLGFEAYGIELDPALAGIARGLAARHRSAARFAEGSFLPAGYHFHPADRDGRLGSIGEGASGYLQLRHPLEDFDLVFGYPWDGEAPVMLDVMNRYGASGARFLLYGPDDAVHIHFVRRPTG